MRTSSMKLTSLLLSLMLASGALAAPVPAPPSGAPGINPPELSSSFVDPGTMGKINEGLKGGVKPPTEAADPLTATTQKAAEGDPNAANGLHRRIIPGLNDITGSGAAGDDATGDATDATNGDVTGGATDATNGDVTGGATGEEGIDAAIAGALRGASIKRADVPPQAVGSAATIVDGAIGGVKKDGLNNISAPPPPVGKRSPDGPVDVATLSGSGVAGEEAGEVVNGNTPGSDIVRAVTAGLARREGPEKCVKPGEIKEGVDCVVTGVDTNQVNRLNDVPKDATSGAATGSPGPGFAGTSSPLSGPANGATGGVPTAGDAAKIASDATKSA